MRRFAAVFVKKDKKQKADVPSPASTLSTPQLSIASDPAHSDDDHDDHDHHHLPPSPHDDLPTKRSWRSWIVPKRSPSLKSPPLTTPHHLDDDDDDDADDAEPIVDDPDDPPTPTTTFSLLLTNVLQPPLPVSPFVQHALGPFFPRSANRPSLLQPSPDTRKSMFRRHLLATLQLSDLCPPELRSYASLPASSPHLSPPVHHFPNSVHPASTYTKTFPSSPGLRRWINRPCFEHRYQVYLPNHNPNDDDIIIIRPVSAASLAVAALEYSEYIDVMVDPDFDQYAYHPENILSDTEHIHQPTQSHAQLPAPDSQPTPAPKRNSYTPAPSPLRHQTNEPPPPPKSILKRNVRFAEDDSSDPEDGLPLHVVRMKKKREQKADFLRQERLKRLREEQEERRRLEAEAREREQQAIEREQRRIALEKERKDREKALYADTIIATRLRREGNRAGVVVPLNNDSLAASTSFSSLKDSERNNSTRFSRSTHDPPPSISIPRKDSSDFALHPPALHYQYDSSPGSSRPPSIAHSPITPHSRPPSTYSTRTSSEEDVRHHSGSWRNSVNVAAAVAAGPGNYPRPPMIVTYPTWSGSNPNFQYIPPVPPFPDYAHDMPLLPPTAPFMKTSHRSRSPSSSSRSRKESSGSSSERVNKLSPSSPRTPSSPHHHSHQQLRQSSAPTSRTTTTTTTTTTKTNTTKPTHQRSGSGESRGTTQTRTSHHTSQTARSQSNLSRGRSLQPPPSMPMVPTAWTPIMPPQMQMQQMTSPQMMMMMPSYPQIGMGPMNMGMNMAMASASASNLHNMGARNMSNGSVGRGYPSPSRRHTQPIIS